MNRLTKTLWRALHPRDAASLLAGIDVPWWIAGGWALEMFRGTVTRPHADLDVGVLRRDISTVLDRLSGWEMFEAKGGRLTRLAPGALPRVDVYSLWGRPTAGDLWAIELMLNEADGDMWVYRRDPRIRRPLATAIRQSADGIGYPRTRTSASVQVAAAPGIVMTRTLPRRGRSCQTTLASGCATRSSSSPHATAGSKA